MIVIYFIETHLQNITNANNNKTCKEVFAYQLLFTDIVLTASGVRTRDESLCFVGQISSSRVAYLVPFSIFSAFLIMGRYSNMLYRH